MSSITCYACGASHALDFDKRAVLVFSQALQYLDQRRRWAEKLQAEGMKAPWSDPIDRLCIVVGMITHDLRDETAHNPSVVINNGNPFLNDFTAWLVYTRRAPKLPTPVGTINAWGLCGCVGWDGPAQYIPQYLADIERGLWEPQSQTYWPGVKPALLSGP